MSPSSSHEPFGVRLAREAATVRHDAVLVAIDLALITAAYALVLLVRFEGSVPADWFDSFMVSLPVALGVHVLALGVCGAYGAM
jgi:hypothetical protein